MRDGDLLEVAAHDARAGLVFYTLEQRPAERPQFKREFRCLGCHLTGDTLGVPGLLMFSSTPDGDGERHVKAVITDQRSPIAGAIRRLVRHRRQRARRRIVATRCRRSTAARPASLASVAGLFDPDGFRAASSDIAALLTFSHQTHMTNLLTRASWEARAADPALHPGAAPERGTGKRGRRR